MRLYSIWNRRRLAFSYIISRQIVVDTQVLSRSSHMETDSQEATEICQLLNVCQPVGEQREFYLKMKVHLTLIHITDSLWLLWSFYYQFNVMLFTALKTSQTLILNLFYFGECPTWWMKNLALWAIIERDMNTWVPWFVYLTSKDFNRCMEFRWYDFCERERFWWW